MLLLSKEQQKRVLEVQEIIVEAFSLNNVRIDDAISALITTALALMKEADIPEKIVEETLKELVKSYKDLKK